ncbi:unnamed protein product [Symbiodinium pilosum]|uniref:Uncharacterized protein n=1 Tax=Symbiodinium pilosum TaxID=2952 RepID=A0A812IR26_SYMPI|nr:unnamed protein product [Symbiodinium pilosum]
MALATSLAVRAALPHQVAPPILLSSHKAMASGSQKGQCCWGLLASGMGLWRQTSKRGQSSPASADAGVAASAKEPAADLKLD